ncbi:MAG: hypothetical protein WCD52_15075 [Xanthobacteraceae bacterium]
MSDQTTRRSLIAGAAALPALAIPAVAATRDPAVDAVQHLKLTAEATYRLVRGLDEAEGDACEQHGHRPIPLVQWRNYDISGSEIDQRRTALLADGGDTRQIEAEYQDAKAREKELIKAGEEWDAEVRITSLRGLARCPFEITNFEVKDGRKANVTNSGFGTVFGVVDGKSLPVCDYAGFAPFGFGYRRCPGEQLTIQVFEDFLRKVWRDKIVFRRLNLANPGQVPIGPNAVIEDDLGFTRSA